MKLSYIIVTHNRREALLRTLWILHHSTPLAADQWEAWVVDNASTDGTVDAVRDKFPGVRVIRRPRNEGVWARSYAFGPAQGRYVVLLDDDSYPTDDAVTRSMDYLDAHPRSAAVVGRVILPDGSLEACALPTVMLSGAVCIRRSVLTELGGFRPEFFRKAGEYDLSYRIWNAGYSIDRFEDVVYRHDKVMTGRSAPFAHRMDLRNNLILVERYLPASLRRVFRQDIKQRYLAIARHAGCESAAKTALWEARAWRVREAVQGRRTLSPSAVEAIFGLHYQARAIGIWAKQQKVERVAVADFGKNLYATCRGCVKAGLEISSIVDPNPAFEGLNYRGLPVTKDVGHVDGVVIANVNPAQVDRVYENVRSLFRGPILRLWHPQMILQKRLAAAA